MEKLHPGVRWVFRLRAYSVLLAPMVFVIILGIQVAPLFTISLGLALLIFASEIYARMAYSRYLYQISSDEIRIEKGIIWKKYVSIPYERVQNVDIHRGVFARMFGFSTVEIETAGSSGAIRYGRRNQRYESEGHLPGVSIEGAEKIRDFVLKKIRKTYGSGL